MAQQMRKVCCNMAHHPSQQRPENSDSSAVAPVRILLVEDSRMFFEMTREMLACAEGTTFVLEWADRVTAGLRRLGTEKFDLVLLDLSLPDSDGLSTFIRVHNFAPHVPIIVLTGLDDETLAVQSVRRGAQDYLLKPDLNIRTLLRAVRYAIERHRLQEKLAHTAEELRAKNAEMEADLQMARELQLAFLSRQKRTFTEAINGPDSDVRFHCRYQPTTALAGDFFDVMPLSETVTGVLIADVMGHGVRAALVTAIVRGLVEELTPAATDPGQFLTKLNRGLTAILRPTEWPIPVSAFYLVADTATGQMRHANAAHPYPICLHRDSGIAELLSLAPNTQRGPILGVMEDAVYETSECGIAPLDLVMLYTDGLYEAENLREEHFGRKRLMAAAFGRIREAAPQLFDGLLADVRQFTGSEAFADDVCLVGMEIMRVRGARRLV
jgi:serine phosphatase RsbU (regulator of sigma subunit)